MTFHLLSHLNSNCLNIQQFLHDNAFHVTSSKPSFTAVKFPVLWKDRLHNENSGVLYCHNL